MSVIFFFFHFGNEKTWIRLWIRIHIEINTDPKHRLYLIVVDGDGTGVSRKGLPLILLSGHQKQASSCTPEFRIRIQIRNFGDPGSGSACLKVPGFLSASRSTF